MKNISKFTLMLTLVASLAVTGCIKETFPQGGSATSEQMTSNTKAFESLLRGIPGYLQQPTTHAGNHYEIGYPAMVTIREMLSNDVAIEQIGYEWFGSWHENQYQGENYIYGQYIWNFYTECVMNCNKVIQFDQGAETPEGFIANIGAAYAYRAMLWLDMGQMYEFKANNYTSQDAIIGLTIPHLHENLTEAEARNNPRLPKDELVELIRADLSKAIEYTHGRSRLSISFPGEAVAYGLLARLEMWAENYDAAKEAAQKAIELSGCTPLTEKQWTDTLTGFNSVGSQNSWMLALCLTEESPAIKTGILNTGSWFSSETSFGYCGAGAFRKADALFYSNIPDADFRKLSWKAPEGSALDVPMIPATSYYDPNNLPELAGVKFRPGGGNTEDYLIGAKTDFPLMRVEEMYFIAAECDARNGNFETLANFMRSYRNPYYNLPSEDVDKIISEVLFQKRVEFWMEGVSFFDFKRCPEHQQILRGYNGTNHYPDSCLNCEGLAPWMNICFVQTETNQNPALVNNPDPSSTVPLWTAAE